MTTQPARHSRAVFRTLAAAFFTASTCCAPAWADETPDLGTLLNAARAAGEDAPDLARITLVEATSRHLLRIEGDIDFPFSIGIDLPLNAEPRSLGTALTGSVDETGRFVVVFDVAMAKASRKVRDMRDQVSRKIVTVNKIDNPAYLRAVKMLDSSSAKLERRPNDARGVKLFDEAQQKLSTTPRYLEQPVYGAYAYKLAEIDGVKSLTVNYLVFDRVTNRTVKSVFDVVERERFSVAYDVDSSDPSQGGFSNDIATERQVRDWERAPVVIPLSQVLDHAVAAGGPVTPAGSTTALLEQFARDRTNAVSRAAAGTYDDRPLNDPRFDSVVAIYTPNGMGSGFYVRSNIVMTNWHVVEKRPIVELRLYDKRETFGQVIAKDVRLDLALVKVQDRGRPVEFFHGKDVMPGESVDAIGHPKRHLFTITRGIVSAIRKSGKTNPAQGGTSVLFIQTDADINPGNSGGPLFKGNKVVGVNAWGSLLPAKSTEQVMVPAPGLNFAIHYSEAKRFLDESMRGE